jgi:hypothetical protein
LPLTIVVQQATAKMNAKQQIGYSYRSEMRSESGSDTSKFMESRLLTVMRET